MMICKIHLIYSSTGIKHNNCIIQFLCDFRHMEDDLTKGLRILNQLAKKLREKRIERGALTLASPEVRFQLENGSQDPVDVGILYCESMLLYSFTSILSSGRNEGITRNQCASRRVYVTSQYIRCRGDF